MEYLYDMTGHVTDIAFWKRICYDTSNTDNWYRLYWEQFYMAYDTAQLQHDEEIYDEVLNIHADTIPIGILDISYYKLKDDALITSNYFDFDEISDILYDKTNRTDEPYEYKHIFAAAPLYDKSKTGKITWKIGGNLYYDVENSPFYNNSNNYQLYVDFNDGNGFILFDQTTVTYHTVDYGALGKYGEIYVHVKFDSDGQLIKYSTSEFDVARVGTPARAVDEVIIYDGLPVSIFRSCNSTPENRKVIIYLEGIDLLDFLPREQRSAEQIFNEMIKQPNISQLLNFGYDFYVVDWPNSRIDMKENALKIVELIDILKGEINNNHEFIIIGESMGGVIARYALTYMESHLYTDPQNRPNANRRERMHNCRLLITLDSPHQGANVPLSVQHLYKTFTGNNAGIFGLPINFRTILKNYNLLFDAKASKQLLIYHIDTKSGMGLHKSYTNHNDRADFLNDLSNIGNFPQHCKTMAVSNGALNGQMQTRFYSLTARTANDRLLHFNTELSAKILWFTTPILGADLELNTNPDGQGKVFQMNAGTYGIRLKFYLFGVNLITGYNSLFNISEYADAKAYCVNSGGYFIDDIEEVIGNSTDPETRHNLSRYWLLNFASFRSGSDGNGTWGTKAHIGLRGFASANFNLSVSSDGMHFGFIPLQSALDFGTLGTVNLNNDFEADINTDRSIINTETPFDVIVAISGQDVFLPNFLPQSNFLNGNSLNNSHLYIKFEGEELFLRTNFPYILCNNNIIYGHWINREIGDDILYLDNYDCARENTIDVVEGMFVNTFNNPWYNYVGGNNGYPGFYSKSNPYLIRDNVNTEFRFDFANHNPPNTINFEYYPGQQQGTSPYNGTYSANQTSGLACNPCEDFGKKAKNKPVITKPETSFAKIYPNPSATNKINLSYYFNGSNKNNISISVLNQIGNTIYSRTNKAPEGKTINTIIDLENIALPSGMYFVIISNGEEQLINKLIKY